MTIQERILQHLAEHPEGVDDDALAYALGLAQRQQANSRCRRLAHFGIVTRRSSGGKIRNFLNEGPIVGESIPLPSASVADVVPRPWFWEGNVQAAVVTYLRIIEYQIMSVANTATREPGKDVVAVSPAGQTLWISAKGFPAGTIRTNPRTQARHWFAHALFDLILWHGEDVSVSLALALPKYETYRKLAKRTGWFLSSMSACIYWVGEDGTVTLQICGSAENLLA